jgi:hypothetical protein
MGDRLLHQRPQPHLHAAVRPLGVAEPVDGAPVGDQRMQCSRALASPRNPRFSRLATSTAAQAKGNQKVPYDAKLAVPAYGNCRRCPGLPSGLGTASGVFRFITLCP